MLKTHVWKQKIKDLEQEIEKIACTEIPLHKGLIKSEKIRARLEKRIAIRQKKIKILQSWKCHNSLNESQKEHKRTYDNMRIGCQNCGKTFKILGQN